MIAIISRLKYENSNFFALSDDGKIGYVASNPSSSWTYNGSLSATETILTDIRYVGTNYFLCLNKSYQYTSTDLTTFTGYYTINDSGFGNATKTSIVYNGSMYVVAGSGGKISTSAELSLLIPNSLAIWIGKANVITWTP